MKKLALGLASLLALIVTFFVPAAHAQEDESNINPVIVARALALNTPAYYQIEINGYATITNVEQWLHIVVVVRKSDWGITNMLINGVEIPLPQAVYAIPLGSGGYLRQMNAYANAFTKFGKFAGYGYSKNHTVLSGQQILLTMQPRDIEVVLPFDPQGGDLSDIKLEIENFPYGYGWGIRDGKLVASVPPVAGKFKYILRRWSDGTPIGGGFIEPFKDAQLVNDAFIGVRNIGNVEDITFDEQFSGNEWVGKPNVKFDCMVETLSWDKVPGKVYHANLGQGGLQLLMGASVDFIVYKATPHGDMPLVNMLVTTTSDRWGNTETEAHSLDKNLGNVVIIVIPKVETMYPPWLNAYRFFDKPVDRIDGGKG